MLKNLSLPGRAYGRGYMGFSVHCVSGRLASLLQQKMLQTLVGVFKYCIDIQFYSAALTILIYSAVIKASALH
jgi:hypothetical protein